MWSAKVAAGVLAVAAAVGVAAGDRRAPDAGRAGLQPVAAVRVALGGDASRLASADADPDAGYVAPVTVPLRVLRRFDPPLGPYGPGHRGVDLDAGPTGVVRAAGAGTIAFAGSVAGRGVVVVRHADGIRTEYEPVRPLVRAGEFVRAGQPIGVVSGSHRGCASPDCLHWGARRGTTYLDPLALLRPLGPVRLLPWSSTP